MSTTVKFNFSEYNTGSADNDGYRIYRNERSDPCPNGIRDQSKEIYTTTLDPGENLNIEYIDDTTTEDLLYVYRISLYRDSDNSETMSPSIGPLLSETSSNIGYPLAKIDENSVNYKLSKKPIFWEDNSDGGKRFIDDTFAIPTPITGASTWNSSSTYTTGDYVRHQDANDTGNGYNGYKIFKALSDVAAGGSEPQLSSSFWQEYTSTAVDTSTGDFANAWYTYNPTNNTYYIRAVISDAEAYTGITAKNNTFGVDLIAQTRSLNYVPFYQNPNFTITSKSSAYFGDSPTITCNFAEGQNAIVNNVFFDEGFTYISLFADIRSDRYRKQADGTIYAIELFVSNGLGPGSFMSLSQNHANKSFFNLSSLLFSDDIPTVALNPWLKKQEEQIQANTLTRSNDHPGLPRALSEYTALDYHWKNPSNGVGAYQMRCGYNTTNNYNLNSGGGWSSGNKSFRTGSTSPSQYLGNVVRPDGNNYTGHFLSKTKLHTLVVTEKHGLTKTFINGHLAHTNESEMDDLIGCTTNISNVNNQYLASTTIEALCPQWDNAGITSPRIPYPGFHTTSSLAGNGAFNFKHNYHNMNEVASAFLPHSAPIEDILNFLGYYQNHPEIGPYIETQLQFIGY